MLEAIFSALDRVNARKDYLDFTLGAVVVDTMSETDHAVMQSFSFVSVSCYDDYDM